MSPSSLALLKGRIATEATGEADSILIQGERIAAVGCEREIVALSPPGTQTIRLHGRLLAPGFHDAHFHFLQKGVQATRPSASACTSLAETGDVVRMALADTPDDEILFVEGWDESRWRNAAWPDRSFLDGLAPTRSVILRRTCGHIAVANSLALERLADVWSGGGIDRQTGTCREEPALALDGLFPPSFRSAREALQAAGELCLSRGITTASDFLHRPACRIYQEFLSESAPLIRLNAYLYETCSDERDRFAARKPDPFFRIRGTKIFADGSLGGRTAALCEDYVGFPGERGTLLHTDDELQASVRRAHQGGHALAVHAIGDRAIAQTLAAFARFPAEENRLRGHRIEHFELPAPGDVERLARTGVRVCMQPNFVGRWAGPEGLYEKLLGPERLRRMNPLRSVYERGVGLFFGSDGMPTSPLYGVRSAMQHPLAEERLTFDEALRLYTQGGAEAVRGDDLSGRIAPGCEADLIVLPAEPLAGVGENGEAEVDLTILAGQIRFRRDRG